MTLATPTPHAETTSRIDAVAIGELLEQHRAARLDQIKAYVFANPVSEQTDLAARRSIIDQARLSLHEIDLALARLREGSFGACAGCARRIGRQRLYAVPFTRFCTRCADS